MFVHSKTTQEMTYISNYVYVTALKGLFVFIVAYVGQGQK